MTSTPEKASRAKPTGSESLTAPSRLTRSPHTPPSSSAVRSPFRLGNYSPPSRRLDSGPLTPSPSPKKAREETDATLGRSHRSSCERRSRGLGTQWSSKEDLFVLRAILVAGESGIKWHDLLDSLNRKFGNDRSIKSLRCHWWQQLRSKVERLVDPSAIDDEGPKAGAKRARGVPLPESPSSPPRKRSKPSSTALVKQEGAEA